MSSAWVAAAQRLHFLHFAPCAGPQITPAAIFFGFETYETGTIRLSLGPLASPTVLSDGPFGSHGHIRGR